MIQNILWDIDGTLLDFEQAEDYSFKKCLAEIGFTECTEDFMARYSVTNQRYWKALERGEITRQQVLVGRFEEFFQAEGVHCDDYAAFNDAYQLGLGEAVFPLDDGVELCRKIKQEGKIRQYAVTNGTQVAQDKKLKLSGLDQIFDGIFISEVLGIEKPNIEFFQKAFQEIGNVTKENTVIVGDSLTSDMRGGNRAGIRCFWYNPKNVENHTEVVVERQLRSLQELPEIIALENAVEEEK